MNGRLLDLALKDHRTDEITEPLMEVLAAFGIMGALWYGGHQVIAGAMTPGDFFSFTAAVALLYGPVRQLSRIMNTVQQSTSSVERVFEILDMPPAIADRARRAPLPGFHDGAALRGRRRSAIPARRSRRCATSRWRSAAARWWPSWA